MQKLITILSIFGALCLIPWFETKMFELLHFIHYSLAIISFCLCFLLLAVKIDIEWKLEEEAEAKKDEKRMVAKLKTKNYEIKQNQ